MENYVLQQKIYALGQIRDTLVAKGIPVTGSYEQLPTIVMNAFQTINVFGFDYWEKQTTLSPTLQDIVKSLCEVN